MSRLSKGLQGKTMERMEKKVETHCQKPQFPIMIKLFKNIRASDIRWGSWVASHREGRYFKTHAFHPKHEITLCKAFPHHDISDQTCFHGKRLVCDLHEVMDKDNRQIRIFAEGRSICLRCLWSFRKTLEKEKEKEIKMSIYNEEFHNMPDGCYVVLNVRGDLRAALISSDHKKIMRWLGRTCRRDTAPRRHAMNAAVAENDSLG